MYALAAITISVASGFLGAPWSIVPAMAVGLMISSQTVQSGIKQSSAGIRVVALPTLIAGLNSAVFAVLSFATGRTIARLIGL